MWNNNCWNIIDTQVAYLDTEEQGGSNVHWLGKAVGTHLPTESQVHNDKGRKSWNDWARRGGNSSANLVLDPARDYMWLLKRKTKQDYFSPHIQRFGLV